MNNLFICNYFLHPIKFQIRTSPLTGKSGGVEGEQRAGKNCCCPGICSWLPCLDGTLTDPCDIQFLSWKVSWEAEQPVTFH